ncbi:MAG: hypothetical protein ABH807_02935 [Candidatus Shapirobacteria bacterium]
MGRLIRAMILLITVLVLIRAAPRVRAMGWRDLGSNLQSEIMRLLGAAVKSGEPVGDQLMETIRKLPEDQLKAVKKQLYQELCEDLLKE